jgi:hypothetical protein
VTALERQVRPLSDGRLTGRYRNRQEAGNSLNRARLPNKTSSTERKIMPPSPVQSGLNHERLAGYLSHNAN